MTTTVTRSFRVAATIRTGDRVLLEDGTVRTVEGTPSSTTSALGGLSLLVRFTDGGTLKVGAGVQLDVERPE